MDKKAWLLSLFTLLVVTSISFSANAADSSIWMNPGNPTKTMTQQNIVESTDDKFCDKHTEYEVEYSTVFGVRKFSKLNPISACWYSTSYGLIGNTSSLTYIKSVVKSNAVVRVANNTELWMSLGDTNAMAYSYYMNSFSRMLYIYENVTSRLTLSKSGAYDQYTIDRSSNPWRLQYANGSLVGTNAFASSQNGEWMVIEGGAGFMRLNLLTKEVLTFDQAMYGYGYGANPTHELAISNDGRYAIVGGGPFDSKIAYVYDLQSCVPKTDRLAVSTGCGKRNFKNDFFPGLVTNRTPFRFVFSNDSESITTNLLNQTGKHDKYIVTAPGKQVHLLEYLALGDSYSSGEGEYDGKTYYKKGTDGDGQYLSTFQTGLANFPYELEKCHLGKRSYPYVLGSASGLSAENFQSVACSGSKTYDLTGKGYLGRYDQYKGYAELDIESSQDTALNNFIPGRETQVEFITKYKPKVVTVGIGGNDINFSDKLVACLMPGTCSHEGDLRYIFGKEVQDLHVELVKTYAKLSNAGPYTRFFVVGYPQIASTNEACKINVRLNYDERLMARNVISYLNEVIKSAAESVGFTYLDVENSLGGKQLCEESSDDLAVQGLVGGDDKQVVYTIGGITFYVEVGNESFHPTHIGHERIADFISAQLNGQSIIDYEKCPILNGLRCPSGNNASPPIPAYFTANGTSNTQHVVDTKVYESVYQVNNESGIQRGTTAPLQPPSAATQEELKLAPSQSVSVMMYSTPRNVGTLSTDANGNVSGSFTVPTDAETGYHTLLINVKDSLYRDVTLFQQIFVYSNLEDFDGDGIVNDQEECGMVNPAGIDEDQDGVDDACDGIIYAEPDVTAPVITGQISTQPNENGWHKDNVTITWSVNDDVDTDLTAPAQVVANQEGEHTYTSSEVCDAAGNCATGSITLKLDKTAPLVKPVPDSSPNQNDWYSQDVTVQWLASDNLSTVNNPASTTADQEGPHTYKSESVCDLAGNCAEGEATVKIDKTPPVVSSVSFSKNPKSVGEESILNATGSDTHSSISGAEYFIADDPGLGNGATMTQVGSTLSTRFGNDFGTGVYKVSIRAQDAAGNWSSSQSDYLVVYDASSGVRFRGARTIALNSSDNQLPWVTVSSLSAGKFAFSVRYGDDGAITRQSDFQFAYKTGENCHKPAVAKNCHTFELNASQIAWLTTSGTNQSYGVFRGEGILNIDGVKQTVTFVVHGVDGERVSPVAADTFSLTIYPTPTATSTAPLYFVAPSSLGRGDIKIRF